ncbi:NANOG neighbor homeobox [Vulpes lagopus]|uniref:NANOG neighbor homeobox n=1 Tax=Vulpes lagopus TaxID=494514 RepID=UPI001BC9E391|nr:NANOG neighbor homeobox [Vulpes lagopus]
MRRKLFKVERTPDTLKAPDTSDFAIQKEPAMLCGQNPEQSNRNHHEDERRKEKWRERGEEKEVEVEEKLEEEEEKEEQCPQERLVSKPLMDTLWAMFKLNKCPTRGDSQSLAFEFNMTVKQIKQWFRKRRKRYNKDMYKQKYKKRSKRYPKNFSYTTVSLWFWLDG